MKKFFLKKRAFTLVELVIVIVILSVLATIAFLNYKTYPQSSRDAIRLTDLTNIRTKMEAYYFHNGLYPIGSWTWKEVPTMTWWIEKEFSEDLAKSIWITKVVDPLTKKNYKYFVAKDRSWYFIEVVKEETGEKIKIWAWAKDCAEIRSARHFAKMDFPDGKYLVFPYLDWEPELVTCKQYSGIPKTCNDLLISWENTDWIYKIYPDWVEVEVYCDMTTDWWGWTRILHKQNQNIVPAYVSWTQEMYDDFNFTTFWVSNNINSMNSWEKTWILDDLTMNSWRKFWTTNTDPIFYFHLFNWKTPTWTERSMSYEDWYVIFKWKLRTLWTWTSMYLWCSNFVSVWDIIEFRSGWGWSITWWNHHNWEFIHWECNDYSTSNNSITSRYNYNDTRVFWFR